MGKNKQGNVFLGFSSLSGSLLLYALSGVIVVGLNDYFTKVGQITIRATASFVVVLIAIVFVTIFRYLKHKDSFSFQLSKKYEKKWLFLEFALRPFSQIAFAYATLSPVMVNGEMTIFGPTSAIFYLFSSKVIFGGIIKLVLGDKHGNKKMEWFDITSYIFVLYGMYLYITNSTEFIGGMSVGIPLALLTGLIESIKTKAMNVLSVESKDRLTISLYEFFAAALISVVVVMLFGLGFTQITFSYEWLWLALILAGLIGAGTLVLELVGFANFDADLGNIVLATELAIAPLLNIQAKHMFPEVFKDVNVELVFKQWVGIYMLIGTLIMVAVVSYVRKRKEKLMEG